MSTKNRFFFVQILIDSVHVYNSYKYDTSYNKLKIAISKFLHYGFINFPTTDFTSNPEEGTTVVKVNKGETFMFPIDVENIESTLNTAYIEFQTLLESDNLDKIKAGIHLLTVGYTRIQLKETLKGLIPAVHTVKSDRPEVAELEGPFVIRKENLQVGTMFLGIRVTMFNSSLSGSIRAGETTLDPTSPMLLPSTSKQGSDNLLRNQQETTGQNLPDNKNNGTIERGGSNTILKDEKVANKKKSAFTEEDMNNNILVAGKKNPNDLEANLNDASLRSLLISDLDKHSDSFASAKSFENERNQIQKTLDEKFEPFDRLKVDMQTLRDQLNRLNTSGPYQLRSQKPGAKSRVKFQREPIDPADLEREYTYVYSELNGQTISMKILYEPKVIAPPKMLPSKCV